MKKYYPILINLENKKCKVIGGGKVAERKVKTLLEHGANVEIISPYATDLLLSYFQEGKIILQKRQYRYGDLNNCDLVFAATDDEAVNKMCLKESTEKKLLFNIIDNPEECSFTTPSCLRRGHLSISISTDGKSPTLAKKIKEDLEEQFTEEYSEYIEILGRLRDKVKNEVQDINLRKEILNQLVYSDILQRYMIKEIDNLEDELYFRYNAISKKGAVDDEK